MTYCPSVSKIEQSFGTYGFYRIYKSSSTVETGWPFYVDYSANLLIASA